MLVTPEFPLPKCSAAGSAATQLSGIKTTPHSSSGWKSWISSTLLHTFLCGGTPKGCTASHSSASKVAKSPQSPVKLRVRTGIDRFLLLIMSYPPFFAQISHWQSSFPLPLSTWLWSQMRQEEGGKGSGSAIANNVSQPSLIESKCSKLDIQLDIQYTFPTALLDYV